ncbi:MAG: homoserine kinase [Planctomycetota bacterium]|nr:homoserine kinase [Planctomycetota bacterium]
MDGTGIVVFAPASIANLSVGFDALGLALAPADGTRFGDIVELTPSTNDDWTLETDGPYAAALPEDPDQNVVLTTCRALQSLAAEGGTVVPTAAVRLTKGLPIGSGLGSSAASIVATAVALHRSAGNAFSDETLFRFMAEMEGSVSGGVHLDNIAPSYSGGLRLCLPGSTMHFGLPWPDTWRLVVAWPGTEVRTRDARAVVPDRLTRATAVGQAARLARFVHLLHAGDREKAAECLVDEIAEPHRAALLPGFLEARTALTERGASAVGISGSGPSIFAIAEGPEIAQRLRTWLGDHYLQSPAGFVHVCDVDTEGARVVDRARAAR